MLKIDDSLTPQDLANDIETLFSLSAKKIRLSFDSWDAADGAPVITENGAWRNRGWTEWTLGFHLGSSLLQFDATDEWEFLVLGRDGLLERMQAHPSNVGIHDHGFQIAGTCGVLLRLMDDHRLEDETWERAFYEQALRVSGAVQAARWTQFADGRGYIYSFNGPHSLFVDAIRTLRSLALAHQLGQHLAGESGERVNLLHRLLLHGELTARHNIYYGEGRDAYDERGRTAHEAIFNVLDGSFRCPSTQQGYSPFTTWTRGLAWAVCGFAEQLEFLATLDDGEFPAGRSKNDSLLLFEKAARATADYYILNTPADGVPYWDTGAPGLRNLGDYPDRPAEPFNEHEPVDSSAAAIAAQGLLRLAAHLESGGGKDDDERYKKAALTIAKTLFRAPYLSLDDRHQGLILHSVYHRPNGWDYIPKGRKIPCGESSQWGDYHARELALMIMRMGQGAPVPCFFGTRPPDAAHA